jgi:hypothetical protein
MAMEFLVLETTLMAFFGHRIGCSSSADNMSVLCMSIYFRLLKQFTLMMERYSCCFFEARGTLFTWDVMI